MISVRLLQVQLLGAVLAGQRDHGLDAVVVDQEREQEEQRQRVRPQAADGVPELPEPVGEHVAARPRWPSRAGVFPQPAQRHQGERGPPHPGATRCDQRARSRVRWASPSTREQRSRRPG